MKHNLLYPISINAFKQLKSLVDIRTAFFVIFSIFALYTTAIAAIDIDKNPTPTDFYSRYKTTPAILNDAWGNVSSLWLRSNSFVRNVIIGDILPVMQDSTTVSYDESFFGSYGDLFVDGSLVQVQGSWAVSDPKNLLGSLHVIQLNDSGIAKINWTSIEGTTSPWIGDFAKTGKPQIFVPGFRDFDVIPTQSYLVIFNKQSSSFLKMPVGIPTTSHTSFLGSWNNDGFPTVLATSYGSAGRPFDIRDNLPALYQADGTGGVKQNFLGNLMLTESSVAFGDLNGDGIQDLITGDTSYQLPSGNWVTDKASYVHFGNNGGSYTPIRLPDPYFAAAKYDGVDSVFDIRTHEIAIRVLDINGDGKQDILISSMVWSNITPYRIIQMLIQQPDGSFKDETDQRLFNFDLRVCGAHQVFIEDINGDGFPDIILSDTTGWTNGDPIRSCATQGNEVLLNDGEGNFVSIMKDSE